MEYALFQLLMCFPLIIAYQKSSGLKGECEHTVDIFVRLKREEIDILVCELNETSEKGEIVVLSYPQCVVQCGLVAQHAKVATEINNCINF